jgi:hypothetical protein
MATNETMTVAEFKRLVAAIDDDHDWKDIWYVEVCGHHDHLVIALDEDRGITIVGDRD